jgi:branched-chain amino acid aminotransferase
VISPPGSSILRGISRFTVFELAAQCGLQTKEANFQPYDVLMADEAFLSVTSRCILPVVRINGVAIGSGSPGPVVERLLAAWSELVGMDIVGQALAHLPADQRPARPSLAATVS